MRFRPKSDSSIEEGDLTPMIDMTFQLIAFFMVVINFTQTEQIEGMQLPKSTLAKPPDKPLDYPITLHLKKDGNVVLAGNETSVDSLRPLLINEANAIKLQGKKVADSTIIIRADRSAQTGKVQQLISICQSNAFEKFALRAKEDIPGQ